MSNEENRKAIESFWFQLDGNIKKLSQAVESDEERADLTRFYVKTRAVFLKSTLQALEDDAPGVVKIREELQKAEKDLKGLLKELEDVVKVMKIVGVGTKAATKLIALTA